MNVKQKFLLLLVAVNLGLTAALWHRQQLYFTARKVSPPQAVSVAVAAPEIEHLRTRVARVEDKLRLDWSTLGPGRDDPRGIRKYP